MITDSVRDIVELRIFRMVYAELQKAFRMSEEDVTRGRINGFNPEVLLRAQQYSARVAGNITYGQLKTIKGRGSFGFNERWNRDVQLFMLQHNVKYITRIDERTRVIIRQVIQKGLLEGWSPRKIATEIRRTGVDMNTSRARIIARTETTRGMNMGVMLGGNEYPYELKKDWIDSGDDKVRRSPFSHRGVQDVDFEKPFFNGEEIGFPGDPEASASNTVSCRCSLALVPKRDANGDLIPKRRKRTGYEVLTGALSALAGFAFGDFIAEELF